MRHHLAKQIMIDEIGREDVDDFRVLVQHLNEALRVLENPCEYSHAHTKYFCGNPGCREA